MLVNFEQIKERLKNRKLKKQQFKEIQKLQNLDRKLVFNLSKKSKFKLPIPNIKQLKHIKKFLSSKELSFIKILFLIIIVNITIIGLWQYNNHVTIIPASGGEYTEGLIGSPKTINPVFAQTDVDTDLTKLIYSGLLTYDKNQQLIPDIASAYEISDNQKEYIVHLKNNVYWHDNNKLTANDVLFTFSIIKSSEYGSPLHINFDGTSIEKIDDYTVKFILTEPYAPFPSNLTFGILPLHIWESIGPQNFQLAEYNIKPIGSGPYKFKSLIKDKNGVIKSITLESFEKHYSIVPLIDSITFKFYNSYESAVESLINKNIQGLSILPRDNNEKITSSERFNIHKLNLPQYTALFFNLAKKNAWAEKDMRQALAYLINKESIINDVLNNNAKSIDGPILPGLIGYKEDVKKYEFNPDKAAEIFQNNEWEIIDNIWTKDDTQLTLTITTIDRYDNNNVADALKEMLEAYGVKVILQKEPFSEIKQLIKQRDYEALLYGELIGADPDPYPFWHSTQRTAPGLNLACFGNKQVDELIEQARQVNLPEDRAKKYEEFADLIIEEIPALFLYSPLYSYVQEKNIRGFDITSIINPSDRFNNIEKWYIKEKRVWK